MSERDMNQVTTQDITFHGGQCSGREATHDHVWGCYPVMEIRKGYPEEARVWSVSNSYQSNAVRSKALSGDSMVSSRNRKCGLLHFGSGARKLGQKSVSCQGLGLSAPVLILRARESQWKAVSKSRDGGRGRGKYSRIRFQLWERLFWI